MHRTILQTILEHDKDTPGQWGPSAEAKGLSTDLNCPLSDGDLHTPGTGGGIGPILSSKSQNIPLNNSFLKSLTELVASRNVKSFWLDNTALFWERKAMY